MFIQIYNYGTHFPLKWAAGKLVNFFCIPQAVRFYLRSLSANYCDQTAGHSQIQRCKGCLFSPASLRKFHKNPSKAKRCEGAKDSPPNVCAANSRVKRYEVYSVLMSSTHYGGTDLKRSLAVNWETAFLQSGFTNLIRKWRVLAEESVQKC